MKKLIAFIYLAFLLGFSQNAVAKRWMVIVGNSAYKEYLNGPEFDVEDIKVILESAEFELINKKYNNLSCRELSAIETKINNQILEGDDVIIYYSGHGWQFENQNYILPVKSGIPDDKCESYSIKNFVSILNQKKARLKFIILDACRRYEKFGLNEKSGLGEVFYSTDKGSMGVISWFASDFDSYAMPAEQGSRNSIFTKFILDEFRIGINNTSTLSTIFDKIKSKVEKYTNGKQVPQEIGASSNYVLAPKSLISVKNDDYKITLNGINARLKIFPSSDKSKNNHATKLNRNLIDSEEIFYFPYGSKITVNVNAIDSEICFPNDSGIYVNAVNNNGIDVKTIDCEN